MNDIPGPEQFTSTARSRSKLHAWSKLMVLAEMIEIDDGAGTLSICNGEARIVLRADGVIRVEGRKIIQSARENIAIDAAYIDLN